FVWRHLLRQGRNAGSGDPRRRAARGAGGSRLSRIAHHQPGRGINVFRWLFGKGARPARVAEQVAAIDPDLWAATLARHRFLQGLSDIENESLLQRVAWLIASKGFSGAHDLSLT